MRRCAVALFAIGLGFSASPLLAQSTGSCPAVTGHDTVFLPCQVNSPQSQNERPDPIIPSALQAAKIAGRIHIKYVVDTSGRVQPRSLEMVESTHDLYTMSLRNVVPKWRFAPATYQQKPVRVRREEIFEFNPRFLPLAYFLWGYAIRRDTTTDGIPRTTIGAPYTIPDTAARRVFSDADLLAAQQVVLKQIAGNMPGPRVFTVCVSLWTGTTSIPPSSKFLAELTNSQRRAVRPDECPRTYDRMIVVTDALGKPVDPEPPGWVNPYWLTTTAVEVLTPMVVWITVQAGPRTAMSVRYECGARWEGAEWRPLCRADRSHYLTVH